MSVFSADKQIDALKQIYIIIIQYTEPTRWRVIYYVGTKSKLKLL